MLRKNRCLVTKQFQVMGTDYIYGGDELSSAGLSIPTEMKDDFPKSFEGDLDMGNCGVGSVVL